MREVRFSQELSLLDYLNNIFRLLPWRSLGGLVLAILAQSRLEPYPRRDWAMGVTLYLLAAITIGWASWRGEWRASPAPRTKPRSPDPLTVRAPSLVAGLIFCLVAFLAVGGNRFTWLNTIAILLALFCLIRAFWITETRNQGSTPRLTPWGLLVGATLVLATFFRFYRLAQIPPEMNSDHAEKILDVLRLLMGQTLIFFPNNGGREALQMYFVAGLHQLFQMPLDFMALKTISSLAGFLSLPFIYLVGREVANPRVGLLSLAFAGVAYWPNVVSRLGLRLPFYILFTAAFLFFLIRGLRTVRRNDFILAGVILGLSLYGYSADRILPLVMLLAVGLFLLHQSSYAKFGASAIRNQIIWFGIIALIFAIVIVLPMWRYMLDSPDSFLYRSLSRMSGLEQPLPGPAWLILLKNLGRALAMFSWSNGEIWTASVPYRPALDIASGSLFWCGVIVILVSYIKKHNWLHLFLLISIPILMLPSILALAFPGENPNLYRTGGAVVPVFSIIGIALDGLMRRLASTGLKRPDTCGRVVGCTIVLLMLALSAFQSYRLVFQEYPRQYALSAWNTSEMAQVVQDFAREQKPGSESNSNGTIGAFDHVWIVGYPNWADTRLVAILTGNPLHNFLVEPQDIKKITDDGREILFLLKPEDKEGLNILLDRYPDGLLKAYTSRVPGKDFLLYFVPQH